MSDEGVRRHVHEAIQSSISGDEELDGAMLMGWVCVVEWMHPSGDRWLSRLSANTQGDRPSASWQMQGYLHNALHDWPEGEAD
jgi:hypothetical protein